MRHRLQRREEGDHAGSGSPSPLAAATKTGPSPECLKDLTLHVHVSGDVPPRRRDARVAKVGANDGEVDAGLEKCYSAAVTKHMRADPAPPQSGQFERGLLDVLGEKICGAVAREWTSHGAAKDAAGRSIAHLDQSRQSLRCVRPQLADPLFRPLAANPNVSWRREMEIVVCHPERFADARASVVKEKQQGMIAQTREATAIGLVEQHPHVLGLQVFDCALTSPLGSNREYASVLLGMHEVMAQEMLCEAPYGGEAAVSCCGLIAASSLDMIEERKHVVDDDVVDRERVDRAAEVLRQEYEEEPQRMAVGAQRVRARAAHPSEMGVEVRLHERQQRLSTRSHAHLRRAIKRPRNRRAARCRSCGVAVRYTSVPRMS